MTRLAQGEALADRLAMYDGLWRPVPRAVAFSAITTGVSVCGGAGRVAPAWQSPAG